MKRQTEDLQEETMNVGRNKIFTGINARHEHNYRMTVTVKMKTGRPAYK